MRHYENNHPQGVKASRGWNELIDQWRKLLEQLALDFQQGSAAVDPVDDPKPCQYCHLQLLCRIREVKI